MVEILSAISSQIQPIGPDMGCLFPQIILPRSFISTIVDILHRILSIACSYR
jgi:hypothetical protein